MMIKCLLMMDDFKAEIKMSEPLPRIEYRVKSVNAMVVKDSEFGDVIVDDSVKLVFIDTMKFDLEGRKIYKFEGAIK